MTPNYAFASEVARERWTVDPHDRLTAGGHMVGERGRGARAKFIAAAPQWAVLSSAPHEAQAVLDALRAGRVDGSTYRGECACLVGTIANARHCDVDAFGKLTPDSTRLAETWFLQIRPGNTPKDHQPTALAAQWVAEWIGAMQAAFGERTDRMTEAT